MRETSGRKHWFALPARVVPQEAADLRAPAKPTLAAVTNSANEPEKPKHVCDDEEQEEKGEAGGEGACLGGIEVMC